VQRVFFPNVNDATIRVLNAEGCDVVVPPAQAVAGRSRSTAAGKPKPRASPGG